MSWEALRLTSKAPSEVFRVLGPHGVEELLHQARNYCWRQYPEEQRTLPSVRKVFEEVFERNMKIWSAIKKPSPAAFFENLLPNEADRYVRQALVTCWMMLPRAGGRDFKDTGKIVRAIFDRTLTAWEEDGETFTTGKVKKPPKKTPKPKSPKAKLKRR